MEGEILVGDGGDVVGVENTEEVQVSRRVCV